MLGSVGRCGVSLSLLLILRSYFVFRYCAEFFSDIFFIDPAGYI